MNQTFGTLTSAQQLEPQFHCMLIGKCSAEEEDICILSGSKSTAQDQIRIGQRERRRNRIPFLYVLLYPLQTKLSSTPSALLLPTAEHQKAVSLYPLNSFWAIFTCAPLTDKVIRQERSSLGKLQITQNHRMN